MYSYSPRKKRRALKGYVLPNDRTHGLRRRIRWRRLVLVFALLAAVAGGIALFRSPLLRVQEVEVVGASNVSAQQIVELADLEGASMFNAPLGEAEARIVALPLVKGAEVELSWPNKVRIQVVERVPWGYWNLDGTSYVIDADGVILPTAKPSKGAPVINDMGDPAPLSVGDRVDADAVKLAQLLLKSVPEQLSLKISRFEYRPDRGLSLITNVDYEVVVGDSQNLDYKLAVWQAVEKEIGRSELTGQVLDLRFRDRPSVSQREEAMRR